MVKDRSDDKGQAVCDYKIFHKKDGLLMQNVYGDAVYGDIKVQNITEDLKRIFEEELRIGK